MKKLEKEFMVDFEFSAKVMGSGDLEVLATPAIISFAENTCAAIAMDLIAEEETTVGIKISMDHLAASTVNAVVIVQATLIEQKKNRLFFTFEVQEQGKLLATGEHQRAIVNRESFMGQFKKE